MIVTNQESQPDFQSNQGSKPDFTPPINPPQLFPQIPVQRDWFEQEVDEILKLARDQQTTPTQTQKHTAEAQKCAGIRKIQHNLLVVQ